MISDLQRVGDPITEDGPWNDKTAQIYYTSHWHIFMNLNANAWDLQFAWYLHTNLETDSFKFWRANAIPIEHRDWNE